MRPMLEAMSTDGCSEGAHLGCCFIPSKEKELRRPKLKDALDLVSVAVVWSGPSK